MERQEKALFKPGMRCSVLNFLSSCNQLVWREVPTTNNQDHPIQALELSSKDNSLGSSQFGSEDLVMSSQETISSCGFVGV